MRKFCIQNDTIMQRAVNEVRNMEIRFCENSKFSLLHHLLDPVWRLASDQFQPSKLRGSRTFSLLFPFVP